MRLVIVFGVFGLDVILCSGIDVRTHTNKAYSENDECAHAHKYVGILWVVQRADIIS